jgi:hypothetical protein
VQIGKTLKILPVRSFCVKAKRRSAQDINETIAGFRVIGRELTGNRLPLSRAARERTALSRVAWVMK